MCVGPVKGLASAEGLAPQDGDTLRALKESFGLQKTLAFPTHLMGL